MTNVKKEKEHELVLAIDPATRGFGYALFEGPKSPVDWGTTQVRVQKNKRTLKKIQKLIDFYNPEVIILEDYAGENSRRCVRIQNLIAQIEQYCKKNDCSVEKYSRSQIQEVFSLFGARSKYEIANSISEWLPEFSPRIPPVRKAWMSEDERMNIFDAVSLALTYYYLNE